MLRPLIAALAALAFSGSALAPQPAFVTPDQEGDGRQVGWTSTFCYGWWCHQQRYLVELTSSPPPPFLGTTASWMVYLPQPADPEFEGELAHHQKWIVHLRPGWHYELRVRATTWITPNWNLPYTARSEWASQSFAVAVAPPPRRG